MTTEDDFQAALDADPTDFTTRLVFADWLDEQGDPRAAGYRVMGERGLFPLFYRDGWEWLSTVTGKSRSSTLRTRWHSLLTGTTGLVSMGRAKRYPTRRAAEDDAALAYAKLPVGSYV